MRNLRKAAKAMAKAAIYCMLAPMWLLIIAISLVILVPASLFNGRKP
jgi:hypothetical protein